MRIKPRWGWRFSASDPAKKCGSACGEIAGAAISRRLRWRRRWRPGIMRFRLAPCGRAGRLLPCKAALSRRKRDVFSPDSIAWCRRLAEGAARSACRRGSLVLPWAWRLSPAFFRLRSLRGLCSGWRRRVSLGVMWAFCVFPRKRKWPFTGGFPHPATVLPWPFSSGGYRRWSSGAAVLTR